MFSISLHVVFPTTFKLMRKERQKNQFHHPEQERENATLTSFLRLLRRIKISFLAAKNSTPVWNFTRNSRIVVILDGRRKNLNFQEFYIKFKDVRGVESIEKFTFLASELRVWGERRHTSWIRRRLSRVSRLLYIAAVVRVLTIFKYTIYMRNEWKEGRTHWHWKFVNPRKFLLRFIDDIFFCHRQINIEMQLRSDLSIICG